MRILNLGILAHVDAGKTTLTERLLHTTGVIDRLGSVDDGNTTTDTLALERQRGITIKAAVASFTAHDVTVNLIDTPGHPDFIAEVERVLGVLDGAVLVVSAVEGVQAQTRVLMRALQRLRIPTLLFVNKTDRRGADPARVRRELRAKLSPAAVAVDDERALAEVLAEHDDGALEAWVEGAALPCGALAAQSRRARVFPVFAGSARTGEGVDALVAGVTELLPASDGDSAGPAAGTVFKIERSPSGEKVAYVRMFAGAVRARDRLGGAKVTHIRVFDGGDFVPRDTVRAGEIGKLWGLPDVRIGDAVGELHRNGAAPSFAPPTLETVVAPRTPEDRGRLRVALDQLAEQDPLIGLRQQGDQLSVSLYGEVQKEVVRATLAADFGVEVAFRESTTICIERPTGCGEAFEIIDTDGNPFLATVGLRVEPGDGVTFGLGVERGSMPAAFFTAVEETVYATLEERRVTDCAVTMTHSGYWARQSHAHQGFNKAFSSTAGDFRQLTPLVLRAAMRRAGTEVLEPVHHFTLEVPADTLGPVLPAIAQLGGVPGAPVLHGDVATLEGDVPAARVHELRTRLPGLTRGEALLESAFDRYEPVSGRRGR